MGVRYDQQRQTQQHHQQGEGTQADRLRRQRLQATRDDQAQEGQGRQQIMGLLAADEREQDHVRQHEDGAEADAGIVGGFERAFQRTPDGRLDCPRHQHEWQQGQIPPPGPLMRKGMHDIAAALLPQDQACVVGAAYVSRRQGPDQGQRATDEQGDRHTPIMSRPRSAGRRILVPERPQQHERQQMHEHHRSLGQQSQAKRKPDPQPSRRPVLTYRLPYPQRRQQHAGAEQQIEHHHGAEGKPVDAAAQ